MKKASTSKPTLKRLPWRDIWRQFENWDARTYYEWDEQKAKIEELVERKRNRAQDT